MKKQAERRTGNGRDCITHPEHGASIVMSSGREWCPAQAHDGKHDVKPTTPWLDKQNIVIDDEDGEPMYLLTGEPDIVQASVSAEDL